MRRHRNANTLADAAVLVLESEPDPTTALQGFEYLAMMADEAAEREWIAYLAWSPALDHWASVITTALVAMERGS